MARKLKSSFFSFNSYKKRHKYWSFLLFLLLGNLFIFFIPKLSMAQVISLEQGVREKGMEIEETKETKKTKKAIGWHWYNEIHFLEENQEENSHERIEVEKNKKR